MATLTQHEEPAQAGNFTLWVKVQLLNKRLNVKKLAKKLKVHRNSLSLAINHESINPGLKERIRKALK